MIKIMQMGCIKLPKIVFLLFIIGFIIRVAFVVGIKSYTVPQDWEYGCIARNIITGNGFCRFEQEPTSSQAPLYPYFLAIFYHFGQNPTIFFIIQLFQAFLSSIMIIILYRTSLFLFNETTAVITSFIITFYPSLIYFSLKLVPTTLFLFLISVTILLIYKLQNNKLGVVILTGVMMSLSILCDPIAFGILLAFIIWWFIRKEITFKRFCLVIITALIVLLPWTIRNYLVHHDVVPVTTQFGINFWIGNNPYATGTDYYKVFSNKEKDYIAMTKMLPAKNRDELHNKKEIQCYKFYFHEGIKFIKNNPQQFFKLFLKKFYYYWWRAPKEITASTTYNKYSKKNIFLYGTILFFGILGIFFSLTTGYLKNSLLIIIIIFFISNIYILAHIGLMRYRIPVEIYLIIFSSFSIFKLKKYLKFIFR